MKLKPLLPTLKEKKRYLSFEIITTRNLSADSVATAVSNSTLELLGTLEAGKAGIMFLKDKFSNNTGVVKTNHKYVDKVRTALTLIPTVEKQHVIFRTRIVSGTLKKAQSKFSEMRKQEV
ncbi:MAG TPA: Rpp14/Pop5 family protein [Candidatus Nanoarchaeia archaeon]|nr:Rpp14/Pop5 family protein [Candidatus Nanoarchaeia archaeon]